MLFLGFLAWFLGAYTTGRAIVSFGWFAFKRPRDYVIWGLLSLCWPATMILGGALLLIIEAFL